MRLPLVALLTAVLATTLALTAAPSPSGASSAAPESAAAAAELPSKEQWEADVKKVMEGSTTHLYSRARRARANDFPVRRLAVNLDIDNTSLASHYDHGQPIGPVLQYVRAAHRLGIGVFFNSHRPRDKRTETLRALRAAGFRVDRLCLANRGEGAVHSKKRCRASFRADGFRLIGNVGNRRTDFEGGGYERAYKLPDYDNQLG